jgi:hypothetical protein
VSHDAAESRSEADFIEKSTGELLQLLPWLRGHIAVCQAPEHLAFRAQSPHSSDAVCIWLDHEEITVGFGAWHAHFDESEVIDAGILVNELVDGKRGVCEHYVSGRWQQSALIDLEKPDEWPVKIRHLDESVKIRGWKGVLWEGKRSE